MGNLFGLSGGALVALYALTLQPWTTSWWAAVLIGAAVFIYSGAHLLYERVRAHGEKMGPAILAIVGIGCLVLAAIWYRAENSIPSPNPLPAPPANLVTPPRPLEPLSAPAVPPVSNSPGSIIAPSGGINTIINQAPPPQLKIITPAAISQRPDGSFDRYFTIDVSTASPPGNLVIAVKGKTVTAIGINPITQGMVSSGAWVKDDIHYVRIQSPFGKYQITINTTDSKSTPEVNYGFNQ